MGLLEGTGRKKFGRPQKPLPRKFKKIYECYQLGLITAAEATCLETNRVSFKRMVERYEQEKGNWPGRGQERRINRKEQLGKFSKLSFLNWMIRLQRKRRRFLLHFFDFP